MTKLVFETTCPNTFRNDHGELCTIQAVAIDGHIALIEVTHLDWDRHQGEGSSNAKVFKIGRALTVQEEKAVEWVRNSQYKRNWRVVFQKTLDEPGYKPENEHIAIIRALFSEERRLAALCNQQLTVETETTDDWRRDAHGNTVQQVVVKQPNRRIALTVYQLEEGKTTLRGEHPKLADDVHCAYPDRLSCNSGVGFRRCEYMKYIDAPGVVLSYGNGTWQCTYKEKKPAK